jgi:hypothetical protein
LSNKPESIDSGGGPPSLSLPSHNNLESNDFGPPSSLLSNNPESIDSGGPPSLSLPSHNLESNESPSFLPSNNNPEKDNSEPPFSPSFNPESNNLLLLPSSSFSCHTQDSNNYLLPSSPCHTHDSSLTSIDLIGDEEKFVSLNLNWDINYGSETFGIFTSFPQQMMMSVKKDLKRATIVIKKVPNGDPENLLEYWAGLQRATYDIWFNYLLLLWKNAPLQMHKLFGLKCPYLQYVACSIMYLFHILDLNEEKLSLADVDETSIADHTIFTVYQVLMKINIIGQRTL